MLDWILRGFAACALACAGFGCGADACLPGTMQTIDGNCHVPGGGGGGGHAVPTAPPNSVQAGRWSPATTSGGVGSVSAGASGSRGVQPARPDDSDSGVSMASVVTTPPPRISEPKCTGSETCDPMSNVPCAGSCDDGDPCTTDSMVGDPSACSVVCMHTPIKSARGGDGCCPFGANIGNDSDCQPKCGDGVVSDGETCDGKCPTSCPDKDACTKGGLSGVAMDCSAVCGYTTITATVPGDGCCPSGANATTDGDCKPACGNGIKESGELCDGDCPTSCDDGNPQTDDAISGSGCNVLCVHKTRPSVCGNGMVEPGEECDTGAATWECVGCKTSKKYAKCTNNLDCEQFEGGTSSCEPGGYCSKACNDTHLDCPQVPGMPEIGCSNATTCRVMCMPGTLCPGSTTCKSGFCKL